MIRNDDDQVRLIREIIQKTSLRVFILSQIRQQPLEDVRGLQVLHRAQVRPFLKYSSLTWMSYPCL